MSISSKRICAYLLDILLVYLFLTLLVNIKFINPYYEEYDGTPIKHLFSFEYLPDRNNYEFIID